MGNCTSSSSTHKNRPTNPDTATSRLIDRQIRADEKRLKTEVKLLLLGKVEERAGKKKVVLKKDVRFGYPIGAGESGKTTILKQMRLLHTAGFDAAERESFRLLIFNNITSTVQTIVEAMDTLQIDFDDRQLEVRIDRHTGLFFTFSYDVINRNLCTCLMIPRHSVRTNLILLTTWCL
jgi:guanine nucleotide-binding protein subunit alpha